MGIPLTISGYKIEPQTYKSFRYSFPVVLLSLHEVEFPEYDIDAELSLKELGFSISSPEFTFYNNYKATGFKGLLDKQYDDIYQVLERDGYDVFEDGDFSKKQFAWILFQNTKQTSESINDKIDLLKTFVDFEDDEGELTIENFLDALISALARGAGNLESYIELLKAYVDVSDDDQGIVSQEIYIQALLQALSSEAAQNGNEIDEILDELMRFIDDVDIDYSWSEPLEIEEEGWGTAIETTTHNITICDQLIIKWDMTLESRTYDHIGFHADVTYLCEANSEFCTPDGATAILDYFDYDEHIPDDPDDPWHPESDDEGDYGVLYEQYETKWIRGKGIVKTGDIIEQQVVPYSSYSDAKEAIEFSKSLLARDGCEKEWAMRVLERKDDEDLAEVEFLKKQLPLSDWGKHEPHPIWNEWQEIEDDE